MINKEELKKKETYYMHPLEDCVVRTEPVDGWYEIYLRFSNEAEYKPVSNSNIIMDFLLSSKDEPITKEEYYKF